MTPSWDYDIALRRITLAAIGAIAGIAAYALVDILPDAVPNGRILLGLSVLAFVGFAGALVMTGPIPPLRAAIGAALWAGLTAVLVLWASFRFDRVEPFLETGHPFVAGLLFAFLPMPFWVAIMRSDARWSDYEVLFDEAWRMVVRLVISAAFTGIFWLVVALSDALLDVVGIGWIGDLLSLTWLPYLLSGLVFGVGLAVVHEFASTLSPYLPLRLLRLILPVVVVVTAIFLIAVPIRGLSGLFSGLSSAGTMIAAAALGVALVAIAVDRRDDLAVARGVLRLSARAMSVIAGLLGALAIWAIMIRVGDFGWTPNRIAALTAAICVIAYGTVYGGLALFGRGDWMRHLRVANVWLALGVIGVSGLWLTPVLNPQRIAAETQADRWLSGEIPAEALDLWAMRAEYGRAGARVLERLAQADHPERAAMDRQLAALEDASYQEEYEAALSQEDTAALVAALAEDMPVLPAGSTLQREVFDAATPSDLRRWQAGCDATTPAGRPGCVALVADLDPTSPNREVVLFYQDGARVRFEARDAANGAHRTLAGDFATFTTPDVIDRLVSGDYAVMPINRSAIRMDGREIFINP